MTECCKFRFLVLTGAAGEASVILVAWRWNTVRLNTMQWP